MKQSKGEKLIEDFNTISQALGYASSDINIPTFDNVENLHEEARINLINYIKKLENMNTKMRKELKK
jgi:hypothetical protein